MCFLIGGYDKEGRPLLGSVSDDPYDIRTFVRTVRPEGALAHIGTELISTTEHNLAERGYFANPGETTRGLNESGLAFTCAMIIEREEQKKATSFATLTSQMMNQCKSVDEAIALFEAEEAIYPCFTLLLADAKGDLAQVEVGSKGTVVYERFSRAHRGTLFAVNCYLSASRLDLCAPHTLLTRRENNNSWRRERGADMASGWEFELSVERVAQILSDHQNSEIDPTTNPVLDGWGFSICNHGTRHSDDYPIEDLPWGTVSAEIIDPCRSTFHYAYGWPCGSPVQYGDQLYQENSWGEFRPFRIGEEGSLTTPDGCDLTRQPA